MLEDIKTNKIKRRLISSLIINSIVLIIVSILIYLQIDPINEISAKKEETNILLNEYNKNISYWITFADFNNKKSALTDIDSYKKNIIDILDIWFYNKFFINTWTDSYENFLLNLWKSINEKIWSKEFKDKQKLLSTILPIYSNSALMDWTITDSTFINNIETLIDKFNLSTSDSITVSDIIAVEDLNTKKIRKSLLDSEIYYFKLPLKLTWTKKDVIDFIHYVENVWSIQISGNDINLYKDYSDNYEWQVAEIESIKIWSYLDSDKSTINKWSFTDFIKNNQWNEKLDIEIVLNFYVKWLASYKVQDYVNLLNKNYTKLSKDTTSLISKIDQNNPNFISTFNKLNSIKIYLDNIKKEISDLNVKARKSEDIGNTYSQAYKFTNSLNNLSNTLDELKKNIDYLKNNKK